MLETIAKTTSEVLPYNVFSMMNAKDVLGGNPFDNQDRDTPARLTTMR